MNLSRRALVIGNSDGIGLAFTRRLLDDDWQVSGLSRSDGRVGHARYEHTVVDVGDAAYARTLGEVCDAAGPVDLCVYCVGTGVFFDPADLAADTRVIEVNLMGLMRTVEVVGARMITRRAGHLIGLSSLADQLISGQAPSYAASKAGMSAYLCGLAYALRPHHMSVTNVRFGFVDTKMAQADRKPFMISADRAADVLMRCVRRRPIQVSYPRTAAVASGLGRRLTTARIWLS